MWERYVDVEDRSCRPMDMCNHGQGFTYTMFRAGGLPVTLAAAVLLGLLGVNTVEAILGKELGDVVLGKDGTLGKAGMVLVVELVRSSHCSNRYTGSANVSYVGYMVCHEGAGM
jgi:hypothetical protein